MLVLDRKELESLVIDGPARITIIRTGQNRVKVGIEAERQVKVLRAELVGAERRESA